jgi:hypothetical protein
MEKENKLAELKPFKVPDRARTIAAGFILRAIGNERVC